MEEQNNMTPWKYIKQHWKLILLVFSFPIIINALTFIPNFQVFEKPNSWTEVWAEYGGALLSAGIALVILYKQQKQNEKVNEAILKQNHEENEQNRKNNEEQNIKNREYQKMSLIYQRKCDWLKDLRKALTNLYVAEDLGKIQNLNIKISNFYKKEYSENEDIKLEYSCLRRELFDIFSDIRNAKANFKLLFENPRDMVEEEKKIIKNINDLIICFSRYINDILWMISEFPPTYKNSNFDTEKIKNSYNYFSYYVVSHPNIIDSLTKYDFNIKEKINSVLKERFEILDERVRKNDSKDLYDLLKYEEKEIDEFLDE